MMTGMKTSFTSFLIRDIIGDSHIKTGNADEDNNYGESFYIGGGIHITFDLKHNVRSQTFGAH